MQVPNLDIVYDNIDGEPFEYHKPLSVVVYDDESLKVALMHGHQGNMTLKVARKVQRTLMPPEPEIPEEPYHIEFNGKTFVSNDEAKRLMTIRRRFN